MNRTAIGAALVVVLLFGAGAWASDPAGVYAIVDKVVLEPNDAQPERIQIWGTFAMAKGDRGDQYEKPVRGFLYFTVPQGKGDTARKEWADLKKVAGTGQCVAFGSRYKDKGRLRKTTDKVEGADIYPLEIGLQKVEEKSPMAKQLREATKG